MASLSPLQVDVYVAPIIPAGTGSSDPNKRWWSPTCCTLIQGPTSAVICDTPATVEQTTELADWIAKTAPGKKLTTLFVTHEHADHFFGATVLLKRFPGLQVLATVKVTEGMKSMYQPPFDGLWEMYFPKQLSGEQVVATPLPSSNTFQIDGHELKAFDVSHSDCQHSSFLHAPSLSLVVGGDIVYGECYQHLGQANTAEKRQGWLQALDMIDALKPQIVVPGHKRASQIDGAYLVDATRRYILDFEEELEKVKAAGGGASDLEKAMKQRYPNRWNDYILERACTAVF